VPGHEKPSNRRRVDRLDLLAQTRERSPTDLTKDIFVAPLAAAFARTELSVDDSTVGPQVSKLGLGSGDAQAKALGDLSAVKRTVSPGVTPNQIVQRLGDRLEKDRWQPGRDRYAQSIPKASGVFGCHQAVVPGNANLDRSAALEQFRNRRRQQPGRCPRFQLGSRQIAKPQQHVVHRIDRAGVKSLG
jgi:hypothetical protein